MSWDLWLALVALFGIGGLTPGPAVMLVLGSSFAYGFRKAMLPALGIASANVIWLLLAVSGAATLLTQFPTAFNILKISGLVVLFYLAVKTMVGPLPDIKKTDTGRLNEGRGDSLVKAPTNLVLYVRGMALQLSSPMPLVYFGLLLPAYVDASQPILSQFTIMLVTVTVTELVGLAFYAYGADYIRRWLSSPKAARGFNVMIGLVMIGSGVWAILSTSH